MNNLKPLVWSVNEIAATINITAESPLHNYTIYPDQYEGGYVIYYFERMTSESGREFFHSSDEAKDWAESTHYPSKMQPYVKPMPTWIDVNERLPGKSGRYMVVHQTIKPVRSKSTPVDIDTYDENEKSWTFFRSGIMQEVTHWMPIPDFKESDCD